MSNRVPPNPRRLVATGRRPRGYRRHRLGGLLAGLAVLAAGFVAAAPANPNGAAVVIGNGNYDAKQSLLPDVTYAHNDADAFEQYLLGVLGFAPERIIKVHDADLSKLTEIFGSTESHKGTLFYRLPNRLKGTAEVVVFYSGHGVPGSGGNAGAGAKAALAPTGATVGNVHVTSYPLERLYRNLGQLPAKSVTVYIDACFSGASQGGSLIGGGSPVYAEPAMPKEVPETMTVFTAAASNQIASWDEKARHGMFTHHLLNALYGAGDANKDGEVTAEEAKDHLDAYMTDAVGMTYTRDQIANLTGDRGVVLSLASGGKFPIRPRLRTATQPFTVETEPAGARVRIMNITDPYRPGMALPAGEYKVEASAAGYETKTAMAVHGASSPTVYRIELRPEAPRWSPGQRFRDCPDCPEMVAIPAGRFEMGCDAEDCEDREKPVHRVSLGADFALGVYEVTVAEFRRFVERTGYRTDAEKDAGKGCRTMEIMSRTKWDWTPGRSWRNLEYAVEDRQPVVCVSWNDAKAYVAWLADETGAAYRLPSEAEWEYAVRVGTRTRYHFGDEPERLCDYGNGADGTKLPNGRSWNEAADCEDGAVYPTAVGSYRPNAFGLYDMHGNVWEWTEDCWNGNYEGAPSDGSAWLSGDCGRRVLRGGSWSSNPGNLRAAIRFRFTTGNRLSNSGFRVARTLAP